MHPVLDADLAGRFARIALGHVTREYPHKPDHVMTSADDVYLPSQVHPLFYGSFDWHSCVHSYWLLARVARLFPALPEAKAIETLFVDSFTAQKVAVECAYLDRPASRGFERTYGWAWALMLSAELTLGNSRHAATLQPLANAFVARFHAFLPLLDYPIRAGTHANTAFALILAELYAAVTGDQGLVTLLRDRARHWFAADRAAPALEPGGDEFLSATLTEAVAMRRLLPDAEFAAWFARFLPELAGDDAAPIFAPARVSDRSDGKIAHLDGLNLSRAWMLRTLAPTLSPGAAEVVQASADDHLAAALDTVAGHYMGEHWLATFALLALSEAA
ncbi:DUF2891 domain-containing protein [Sphingomonas hankookensis]|uniref:DUF2891 domain-containing protein n=1 Tax=Sphingomonas hankookensis TaxID=563996 RepID=UPI001F5774EB|nr:DUF2891 domain-containing protein [Sphingomonas hankookensis]